MSRKRSNNRLAHGLRTPGEAFCHGNPKLLGLGQQIVLIIFWGICGIFGQTISTHFGTVSHLSMFSIMRPLFLQKTKPLYPHYKHTWSLARAFF